MTMQQLIKAIAPIIQRIRGLVTVGVLESVKDDTDIQLVKYTGVDGEVVADAERLQPAGISSNPKPGASMIVLSNQANKDHPIVITIDDGAVRPKGLAPGERTFYDEFGNKIEMKDTGTTITDNQGNTVVMDVDGIGFNGNSKPFVTHAELDTALQTFITTLNTHTHLSAAPASPTGPVVVPLTLDINGSATTTVKTGG